MSDVDNNQRYLARAVAARHPATVASSDGFRASARQGARAEGRGLNILTDAIADRERTIIRHLSESRTSATGAPDDRLHDAISLMVTDALPQIIWSTLPNGYHDYCSTQWYDYTGIDARTINGNGWAGMVHPDDHESAWAHWQYSLVTGEPYEVEYRLRRRDGEYRWMLGCALPLYSDSGKIIRWAGTCTDIHDTRMIADRSLFLADEMDLRITNLLDAVGSLLAREAAKAHSARALAETMQTRLAALNAAQRLANSPTPGTRIADLSLHDIIRAVVEPFENDHSTRFSVAGTDREVPGGAVSAVKSLIEELCANLVRGGVEKKACDTVRIKTRVARPHLTISWTQDDESSTTESWVDHGSGNVLIDEVTKQQLGGTISRFYMPKRLVVIVELSLSRLKAYAGAKVSSRGS